MPLAIRVDPAEHHWTVTLTGELDYSECAAFRVTIDRILKHSPPAVIVDLSHVDYLDSSGLGLLLLLSKEYGAESGRLVLVTNDAVDSILDLTKLSGIFSSATDLDDALSILNGMPNA